MFKRVQYRAEYTVWVSGSIPPNMADPFAFLMILDLQDFLQPVTINVTTSEKKKKRCICKTLITFFWKLIACLIIYLLFKFPFQKIMTLMLGERAPQ